MATALPTPQYIPQQQTAVRWRSPSFVNKEWCAAPKSVGALDESNNGMRREEERSSEGEEGNAVKGERFFTEPCVTVEWLKSIALTTRRLRGLPSSCVVSSTSPTMMQNDVAAPSPVSNGNQQQQQQLNSPLILTKAIEKRRLVEAKQLRSMATKQSRPTSGQNEQGARPRPPSTSSSSSSSPQQQQKLFELREYSFPITSADAVALFGSTARLEELMKKVETLSACDTEEEGRDVVGGNTSDANQAASSSSSSISSHDMVPHSLRDVFIPQHALAEHLAKELKDEEDEGRRSVGGNEKVEGVSPLTVQTVSDFWASIAPIPQMTQTAEEAFLIEMRREREKKRAERRREAERVIAIRLEEERLRREEEERIANGSYVATKIRDETAAVASPFPNPSAVPSISQRTVSPKTPSNVRVHTHVITLSVLLDYVPFTMRSLEATRSELYAERRRERRGKERGDADAPTAADNNNSNQNNKPPSTTPRTIRWSPKELKVLLTMSARVTMAMERLAEGKRGSGEGEGGGKGLPSSSAPSPIFAASASLLSPPAQLHGIISFSLDTIGCVMGRRDGALFASSFVLLIDSLSQPSPLLDSLAMEEGAADAGGGGDNNFIPHGARSADYYYAEKGGRQRRPSLPLSSTEQQRRKRAAQRRRMSSFLGGGGLRNISKEEASSRVVNITTLPAAAVVGSGGGGASDSPPLLLPNSSVMRMNSSVNKVMARERALSLVPVAGGGGSGGSPNGGDARFSPSGLASSSLTASSRFTMSYLISSDTLAAIPLIASIRREYPRKVWGRVLGRTAEDDEEEAERLALAEEAAAAKQKIQEEALKQQQEGGDASDTTAAADAKEQIPSAPMEMIDATASPTTAGTLQHHHHKKKTHRYIPPFPLIPITRVNMFLLGLLLKQLLLTGAGPDEGHATSTLVQHSPRRQSDAGKEGRSTKEELSGVTEDDDEDSLLTVISVEIEQNVGGGGGRGGEGNPSNQKNPGQASASPRQRPLSSPPSTSPRQRQAVNAQYQQQQRQEDGVLKGGGLECLHSEALLVTSSTDTLVGEQQRGGGGGGLVEISDVFAKAISSIDPHHHRPSTEKGCDHNSSALLSNERVADEEGSGEVQHATMRKASAVPPSLQSCFNVLFVGEEESEDGGHEKTMLTEAAGERFAVSSSTFHPSPSVAIGRASVLDVDNLLLSPQQVSFLQSIKMRAAHNAPLTPPPQAAHVCPADATDTARNGSGDAPPRPFRWAGRHRNSSQNNKEEGEKNPPPLPPSPVVAWPQSISRPTAEEEEGHEGGGVKAQERHTPEQHACNRLSISFSPEGNASSSTPLLPMPSLTVELMRREQGGDCQGVRGDGATQRRSQQHSQDPHLQSLTQPRPSASTASGTTSSSVDTLPPPPPPPPRLSSTTPPLPSPLSSPANEDMPQINDAINDDGGSGLADGEVVGMRSGRAAMNGEEVGGVGGEGVGELADTSTSNMMSHMISNSNTTAAAAAAGTGLGSSGYVGIAGANNSSSDGSCYPRGGLGIGGPRNSPFTPHASSSMTTINTSHATAVQASNNGTIVNNNHTTLTSSTHYTTTNATFGGAGGGGDINNGGTFSTLASTAQSSLPTTPRGGGGGGASVGSFAYSSAAPQPVRVVASSYSITRPQQHYEQNTACDPSGLVDYDDNVPINLLPALPFNKGGGGGGRGDDSDGGAAFVMYSEEDIILGGSSPQRKRPSFANRNPLSYRTHPQQPHHQQQQHQQTHSSTHDGQRPMSGNTTDRGGVVEENRAGGNIADHSINGNGNGNEGGSGGQRPLGAVLQLNSTLNTLTATATTTTTNTSSSQSASKRSPLLANSDRSGRAPPTAAIATDHQPANAAATIEGEHPSRALIADKKSDDADDNNESFAYCYYCNYGGGGGEKRHHGDGDGGGEDSSPPPSETQSRHRANGVVCPLHPQPIPPKSSPLPPTAKNADVSNERVAASDEDSDGNADKRAPQDAFGMKTVDSEPDYDENGIAEPQQQSPSPPLSQHQRDQGQHECGLAAPPLSSSPPPAQQSPRSKEKGSLFGRGGDGQSARNASVVNTNFIISAVDAFLAENRRLQSTVIGGVSDADTYHPQRSTSAAAAHRSPYLSALNGGASSNSHSNSHQYHHLDTITTNTTTNTVTNVTAFPHDFHVVVAAAGGGGGGAYVTPTASNRSLGSTVQHNTRAPSPSRQTCHDDGIHSSSELLHRTDSDGGEGEDDGREGGKETTVAVVVTNVFEAAYQRAHGWGGVGEAVMEPFNNNTTTVVNGVTADASERLRDHHHYSHASITAPSHHSTSYAHQTMLLRSSDENGNVDSSLSPAMVVAVASGGSVMPFSPPMRHPLASSSSLPTPPLGGVSSQSRSVASNAMQSGYGDRQRGVGGEQEGRSNSHSPRQLTDASARLVSSSPAYQRIRAALSAMQSSVPMPTMLGGSIRAGGTAAATAMLPSPPLPSSSITAAAVSSSSSSLAPPPLSASKGLVMASQRLPPPRRSEVLLFLHTVSSLLLTMSVTTSDDESMMMNVVQNSGKGDDSLQHLADNTHTNTNIVGSSGSSSLLHKALTTITVAARHQRDQAARRDDESPSKRSGAACISITINGHVQPIPTISVEPDEAPSPSNRSRPLLLLDSPSSLFDALTRYDNIAEARRSLVKQHGITVRLKVITPPPPQQHQQLTLTPSRPATAASVSGRQRPLSSRPLSTLFDASSAEASLTAASPSPPDHHSHAYNNGGGRALTRSAYSAEGTTATASRPTTAGRSYERGRRGGGGGGVNRKLSLLNAAHLGSLRGECAHETDANALSPAAASPQEAGIEAVPALNRYYRPEVIRVMSAAASQGPKVSSVAPSRRRN